MSKKILNFTNKTPTQEGLYLYQDTNEELGLVNIMKDSVNKTLFWVTDYPYNKSSFPIEKTPNCKWFGPIIPSFPIEN